MNTSNESQRSQVIAALVECNSIRSIERMTGIHRDTIMRFTTDAFTPYYTAIMEAFGNRCDYAQLIKVFASDLNVGRGRYSPPRMVSSGKEELIGLPDVQHVSTSYVERQNLSVRMECVALRALQFRARTPHATLHASYGSGSCRSAMDRAGIDRACNFKLGHYPVFGFPSIPALLPIHPRPHDTVGPDPSVQVAIPRRPRPVPNVGARRHADALT